MANGNIKIIFGEVLKTKIVAKVLLASLSDSLSLIQLKYSLNTICSKPETNHVLNRLGT